ncbi:MAG: TIGR01906 family membrane protein [Anaerolineae bacterium]|nr:TIGR01906 family membrane protein [Anaerolineae bacterium]
MNAEPGDTASHRRWLKFGLRVYLTITVPLLLILMGVRFVMTPLFLQFEYNRAGFPVDSYGFSSADRMKYAPYALNYLLNEEDISYLAELRFDDGPPLFNVRELQHMRDVKAVTQVAYLGAITGGLVAVVSALILYRLDRRLVWLSLRGGGLLTLSLVIAIVVAAIVSWDSFFTTFHSLFFEGGTWQFAYSDTLIRLFPEQFWFDAALVIGGLTVIGALLCIGLGQWQLSKSMT